MKIYKPALTQPGGHPDLRLPASRNVRKPFFESATQSVSLCYGSSGFRKHFSPSTSMTTRGSQHFGLPAFSLLHLCAHQLTVVTLWVLKQDHRTPPRNPSWLSVSFGEKARVITLLCKVFRGLFSWPAICLLFSFQRHWSLALPF